MHDLPEPRKISNIPARPFGMADLDTLLISDTPEHKLRHRGPAFSLSEEAKTVLDSIEFVYRSRLRRNAGLGQIVRTAVEMYCRWWVEHGLFDQFPETPEVKRVLSQYENDERMRSLHAKLQKNTDSYRKVIDTMRMYLNNGEIAEARREWNLFLSSTWKDMAPTEKRMLVRTEGLATDMGYLGLCHEVGVKPLTAEDAVDENPSLLVIEGGGE